MLSDEEKILEAQCRSFERGLWPPGAVIIKDVPEVPLTPAEEAEYAAQLQTFRNGLWPCNRE